MKSGIEMAQTTGQLHTKTAGSRGTLGAVLRLRNFRLLWMGQGISALGDQFYLIALPSRSEPCWPWLLFRAPSSCWSEGR
jgi:hypothetical protein